MRRRAVGLTLVALGTFMLVSSPVWVAVSLTYPVGFYAMYGPAAVLASVIVLGLGLAEMRA